MLAPVIRRAIWPTLAVAALIGGLVVPSFDEARPTAARPFTLAGPWFRRPEPAQELAEALRTRAGARRRPAYVVALDDPSLGRIYRVQIGADELASQAADRATPSSETAAPLTGWEPVTLESWRTARATIHGAGAPPPDVAPRPSPLLARPSVLTALPHDPEFGIVSLASVELKEFEFEKMARRNALHRPWLRLPRGTRVYPLLAGARSVVLARLRDHTNGGEFVVVATLGGPDATTAAVRFPAPAAKGAGPGAADGIADAEADALGAGPPAPTAVAASADDSPDGGPEVDTDAAPAPTPPPTPPPPVRAERTAGVPFELWTARPGQAERATGWKVVTLDAPGGVSVTVLYPLESTEAATRWLTLARSGARGRTLGDDPELAWYLGMLPRTLYPGDRLVAVGLRRMTPAGAPATTTIATTEEGEERESTPSADEWSDAAAGFHRFTVEARGEGGRWGLVLRRFGTREAAAAAYEDLYIDGRNEVVKGMQDGRVKTTFEMGFRQDDVAGDETASRWTGWHLGGRNEVTFQPGAFTVSVRSYPPHGADTAKAPPLPFEDLRDVAEALQIY